MTADPRITIPLDDAGRPDLQALIERAGRRHAASIGKEYVEGPVQAAAASRRLSAHHCGRMGGLGSRQRRMARAPSLRTTGGGAMTAYQASPIKAKMEERVETPTEGVP